jgi:hypothetical protein
MHGKKMRRSPIHQDVDTTLVDKVFAKVRVDEELDKRGRYKEGDTRGKKKPFGHYKGISAGGGSKKTFLGTLGN